MDDKQNKKTFAYFLGNILVLVLSGCVISIMLALTISIVKFILF